MEHGPRLKHRGTPPPRRRPTDTFTAIISAFVGKWWDDGVGQKRWWRSVLEWKRKRVFTRKQTSAAAVFTEEGRVNGRKGPVWTELRNARFMFELQVQVSTQHAVGTYYVYCRVEWWWATTALVFKAWDTLPQQRFWCFLANSKL